MDGGGRSVKNSALGFNRGFIGFAASKVQYPRADFTALKSGGLGDTK